MMVKATADFESNITSVERIKEYCQTDEHEVSFYFLNFPKIIIKFSKNIISIIRPHGRSIKQNLLQTGPQMDTSSLTITLSDTVKI